MSTVMTGSPERQWFAFGVLCDCLNLVPWSVDGGDLRRRIGELGWEQLLALADYYRLGSALVHAIRVAGLAPAVPALTLPDGRMTITAEFARRDAEHLQRREVLGQRLDELALAFNAEGIVPIAIKGGRSVRLGSPAWRSLRDLDLLVPHGRAPRAQEIAFGIGYRESDTPRPRMFHHHQRELYRDDMPGWIEIHRRAGLSRVEQFISTPEVVASAAMVEALGRGRVGVLPAHLHVLQGLIHHHVGHRAVKRGIIHPKGLYEFAAEMAALDTGERQLLARRAARHPRLLAVFELWTAAAVDLFGLHLEEPLAADASNWWSGLRRRLVERGIDSSISTGAEDELRAATTAERMRRAAGGASAAKRLYWRITMPLSFVKRPVPPSLVRRPPRPGRGP
ncbi:MAG: hypothetical protein JWQ89_2438 [Devosia sp.]|uniref:nucleotidyltransferase family protein n=1 Tax=Devosia sp. TaxID=1871048 RepID=UPI0026035B1B|nr:nucleotidyltransferase family protein [Devosia sp.]MDB5540711.1 hypothetical protein [Devosia sp.]